MDTMQQEIFMQRCLQLAESGLGNVSPNPMVGCVVVKNGVIIGEGYHQNCGEAHAEVNAINSIKDPTDLNNCTIFVNLEPCAHYGKTPPCADLLIARGIKNIVIGCLDTNPLVAGKGVKKLQGAGINVIAGVLENKSKALNKRFFTFHEKKRPFIVLKWAQTLDGYIWSSKERIISNTFSHILSHKWRAEEDAILIGTATALKDDAELTARLYKGKNPVRILLDKTLSVPHTNRIFNSAAKTIVFTEVITKENTGTTEYIALDKISIPSVLNELYKRSIQSVLIEGGAKTHKSFIKENMWDEARVVIGNKVFGTGIEAVKLKIQPEHIEELKGDKILLYKNSQEKNVIPHF